MKSSMRFAERDILSSYFKTPYLADDIRPNFYTKKHLEEIKANTTIKNGAKNCFSTIYPDNAAHIRQRPKLTEFQVFMLKPVSFYLIWDNSLTAAKAATESVMAFQQMKVEEKNLTNST